MESKQQTGELLESGGHRKSHVEMNNLGKGFEPIPNSSQHTQNMDSFSEPRIPKDFRHDEDTDAQSLGASIATSGHSSEAQAGVKRIEAVSMVWTKWGLIAAYLR